MTNNFTFSTLATLSIILATSSYAANPFGISKGTKLSDLSTSEAGNKPRLKSVPKPHPLFESYFVWAPEETGVCMLIALSKPFDNDRYGNNIRHSFEKISLALANQYGKPKRIDFQKSGALWKDPNDWVMSVRQNERIFADVFENVAETENGSNLRGLEMQITAFRSDTSIIRLQYQFDNFEECVDAIDAEANDSF